MKLYRVNEGAVIATESGACFYATDWDQLINREDLLEHLSSLMNFNELPVAHHEFSEQVVAPIVSQEVWAAGVTYYRSRTARMAESHDAGADNFYDRVYTAERPELFFKSTAHRVS